MNRNEDFLDQFYFHLGRLTSPLHCLGIATGIAAVASLVPLVGTYISLINGPSKHVFEILFLAYMFPFLLVLMSSFVLMRGFHILHERNLNLRRAVDRDELTRLANRAAFYRQDKELFFDARMSNRPLSMIMLDADYFKSINDNFGHLAGDHALQHLSEIFIHCTRGTDLVARWGGEEFIVLLQNADRHGAMRFAERLRKQVSESPFLWNGEQIFLTLSAGVTQLIETDQQFEQLVLRSDKALYIAKSSGRNQVHAIWTADQEEELVIKGKKQGQTVLLPGM